MKKLVVVVLVGLLVVAGLLAFAAVNLNSYLTRNKDSLAERVSTALGREVSFETIAVSLSGGLGVEIGELAIGDDPAFSKSEFLRAGSVSVRIRIIPALFGRYEVKRVALDRPEITLIRSTTGFNAATLGGGDASAKPSPAGAGAGAAVAIALVDIGGGKLEFIDRTVKPEASFTVEDLEVSAADLSADSPLDFVLSARVLGAERVNLRAHGDVGPLGAEGPDATPLDVTVAVDPLEGSNLSRLGSLVAFPPALKIAGPLSAKLHAAGSLALVGIDAEFDASKASVVYGDTFNKAKGVKMSASLSAERNAERITLQRIGMSLADARLDGAGTIGSGEKAPYKVELRGAGVPLAGWDAIVPALAGMKLGGKADVDLTVAGITGSEGLPATTGTVRLDDAGLRRGGMPPVEGLSTTISLTKTSLRMTPAEFRLAGSPAKLSASVADLDNPAVKLSLTALELFPSVWGAGGVRPRRKEVLRGVELDGVLRSAEGGARFAGQFKSSRGTLRDYDYANLAATVRYQDARANLAPLTLQAYGGTLTGTGHYDISDSDNPRFAMDLDAKRVRLGDLISAHAGSAGGVIEGFLDASVSVSGSGKEWAVVRQGLNGSGNFDILNGTIKDVNLAEGVLQGITGIPGLSSLLSSELRSDYPGLFTTGDTHFEDLAAGFRMTAGRMITDDVVLQATDYVVRGKGNIGLDQTVDISAAFLASSGLTQSLVEEVDVARYLTGSSGRIEIPFRLAGRVPGARPRADTDFVKVALQRALVGGLAEKLLGPGGGGGVLSDLLGLPKPPVSDKPQPDGGN